MNQNSGQKAMFFQNKNVLDDEMLNLYLKINAFAVMTLLRKSLYSDLSEKERTVEARMVEVTTRTWAT